MRYPTVEYERGAVLLLDQTKLPQEVEQLRCESVARLIEAIRQLSVRGAPAIGVAAAHGVTLAADLLQDLGLEAEGFRRELGKAMDQLEASRPTAVNLHWALARMRGVLAQIPAEEEAAAVRDLLAAEAMAIHHEDIELCRRMGENGAALLPDPCTVITHCNTGALATAGIGTALGVVYAAAQAGKQISVFVDETRPLLQGARLNTWELAQHGIPATLICDGAAGWTLATHAIDAAIVGADRIAANGDTANKIGTYSLAVLCQRHGVPFYVAAPYSTLDLSLASGKEIPIEERDPSEVSSVRGIPVALEGTAVFNPAFDVTPAELIAGIITEHGVFHYPFTDSFARVYPRPL